MNYSRSDQYPSVRDVHKERARISLAVSYIIGALAVAFVLGLVVGVRLTLGDM